MRTQRHFACVHSRRRRRRRWWWCSKADERENLNSWRRSPPSPTDPVWWRSMHTISSYRGNSPTNKSTNKHTNRQDRLQYTAPLSLARSVMIMWYRSVYNQTASDAWRYNNPAYKIITDKLQLMLINVVLDQFLNIKVSQGSVATRLRCDGIFSDQLT